MSERTAWDLLVRHAAGRLTAADEERLARSSAEDAESERLLRQVDRLVEISRAVDAADHAIEAWQRLERRIADTTTNGHVLPLHHPHGVSVAYHRTPKLWWRTILTMAAAATVVLGVGIGVWRSRVATSAAMSQVMTQRGERLDIGLPDGSYATLGPSSRLVFAARGFARERSLTLEGEGYFRVAHDPAHPFVVHTRGLATQAVGTAFGVRAYQEDTLVQVVVAEGRVLLRPDNRALTARALLRPNDLGIANARGQIAVHRGVGAAQYLGWLDGEIVFKRTPLSDVLRELGRTYDIDIQLADARAGSVPVTATFRRQAADDVAHMLAQLLDMRVRRDDSARIWLWPND